MRRVNAARGYTTMKAIDRNELLSQLEKTQRDSAPITIQIGSARTGHVEKDCIVIKSAPPVVIETLAAKGYVMSITSEGVHIDMVRIS